MNTFGAARAASKKRKLAHALREETALLLNPAGVPAPPPPAAPPVAPVLQEIKAAKLPWRSILVPSQIAFDEEGGMLELDEVEGVDVVYGEGLVTFRVREEQEALLAPPKKLTKKQKEMERRAAAAPPVAVLPSNGSAFEYEDLSAYAGPSDDIAGVDEFNATVIQAEKEMREDVVEVVQPKVVVAEAGAKKPKKKAGKNKQPQPLEADEDMKVEVEEERVYDEETALPSWSHLPLCEPLRRALFELKFETPTAIQERALSVEIGAKPYVAPPAIETEEWGGISDTPAIPVVEEPFVSLFPAEEPTYRQLHPNETDRDLVGVAQTGSGKTLAYGLPILSYILSTTPISELPDNDDGTPRTRLAALILAPTRELALQVRSAISEVAIRTNPVLPLELQDPNVNAPRKRVRGRHISVVALTGGMSIDKQKRQLSRGADILVATPGRLWDLIGEDDDLARAIKNIKFLVIDEADRMIENGHFAELDNIVRLTRRRADTLDDVYTDDFKSATSKHSALDLIPPREDMRTFVFSATMSKDLQRNLKKRHRKFVPGMAEDGMSSLDDLLLKLDFRDPDPELIDLSPEGGLVETLKECKIECLLPDKDVHLYHFLLRYPGRTIVFLSSIDGIRRLHPLLVLLGLNVVALHSGMQQRARLKSLDRFKASPTSIMLATDVAARGLDIPSVSHVVHYTLPRSADVYVHRSGRTARAGQEGLALQLCAPEEKKMQQLLMVSLGKADDLPELPSDFSILDRLKERIELAKKVESGAHKATKEAHEDNWLKQAAEALDIEIDSDMEFSDEGGENGSSGRKTRKALKNKAAKVKALKAELAALLAKPLMMRGVSAKYLTTRNTVDFVDQLVGGTSNVNMLGIQTSTALEDLPKPKLKKRPRPAKSS